MLRLLILIPAKKSFHMALQALNSRRIKDVMKKFDEIGVSPVTISKRHGIKYLRSLYSYLPAEVD
jgi:hypothetical protein